MDTDGGPVIAWETDHAEGRFTQRPSPRTSRSVCLPTLRGAAGELPGVLCHQDSSGLSGPPPEASGRFPLEPVRWPAKRSLRGLLWGERAEVSGPEAGDVGCLDSAGPSRVVMGVTWCCWMALRAAQGAPPGLSRPQRPAGQLAA